MYLFVALAVAFHYINHTDSKYSKVNSSGSLSLFHRAAAAVSVVIEAASAADHHHL